MDRVAFGSTAFAIGLRPGDVLTRLGDRPLEGLASLREATAGDTPRMLRYWRAGAFSPKRLAQGWMPPHPTFYLRRSLYEKLGLFDTRYRIAADYESMLRILGPGGVKPAYVPKILVQMRWGGISNRSVRNMVLKSSEDYSAMRRNGIGGVFALVRKNFAKLPQFMVRAPDAGR